MYHFFVEQLQISSDLKEVMITGSDYNHIRNVLRMKKGEQFSVSILGDDSGKEIFYEIDSFTEDTAVGKFCFAEESGHELPSRIYLFQGLPKVDKMELIIQKAVELGAYRIIPMSTKRCIVKLDDKKASNKIKRWQAIAEAAAKQSKRGIIPEVAMPLTMKQAIEYCRNEGIEVKLIPYENAGDISFTKKIIEGPDRALRFS